MNKIIFLIATTCLASGCTSTVWVTKKNAAEGQESYDKVGGVPFFVKKEILNQSTSYTKSWVKSTLSVEKRLMYVNNGELKYSIIDKKSYEKQLAKNELGNLGLTKKRVIQADAMEESDVVKLVSDYSEIETDLDISAITPELIGNIVKVNWVVNEEEKYYLNAPLPWFGSGDLTQEFASDGTLSKVVSAPDTELAEGISSLIPFKEYFTGKYVDPLSDNSDAEVLEEFAEIDSLAKSVTPQNLGALKAKSKIIYIVSLTVEQVGYLYTFTKTHDNSNTVSGPLPFDIETGQFTRTYLGGPNQEEQTKKDEGKMVGLSGFISFPIDWGQSN